MNLITQGDHIFAPHDIRRYPTELARVPSRDVANRNEGTRSPIFSEIVAGMNSANRVETKPAAPPAGKPFALWEKDGFGFADFIDIINPLQHIPIVATIYRNFSGDQIGAAPRIIGGALWGRIGGLVAGVANAVVEWWSGKDIGEHIYTAIFSPDNKDVHTSAAVQKKVLNPGKIVAREAPQPQSDDRSIATSVAPLPAAMRATKTEAPSALRSETPAILTPATRGARTSYERNRNWSEPDESLGIRFLA